MGVKGLVNYPYSDPLTYSERPGSERGGGGVTKVPAASPYSEHNRRKQCENRTDVIFRGHKNACTSTLMYSTVPYYTVCRHAIYNRIK